jgi:ligand-binding sensor domain-containing protein
MKRPLSAAIALAWVGVLVGAIVLLSRPLPPPDVPEGWTLWPEPGPTRGLVVEPDAVHAGGLEGLYRLDTDGTADRIEIPGLPARLYVSALLSDTRGRLWVGHPDGLAVRTGTGWRSPVAPDRVGHVTALAEMPSGAVRVGTMTGSVLLPPEAPFVPVADERLTVRNGLLHPYVSSIMVDGDDGLWVGTYGAPEGGLSRRDASGEWRYWTPADGLPHPNVTSIVQTRDGRVWVGCGLYDRGGLAVFDRAPGTSGWQLTSTLRAPGDLPGPKVRSLFEDSGGRLWIGTEYDGLTVRAEGRELLRLGTTDGLPSGEVIVFRQGPDGSMWLATLVGVVRIAPDAVEAIVMRRRATGEGQP